MLFRDIEGDTFGDIMEDVETVFMTEEVPKHRREGRFEDEQDFYSNMDEEESDLFMMHRGRRHLLGNLDSSAWGHLSNKVDQMLSQS